MSCSPFDLRDYVLNELADSERRQVETHVAACPGCREELDRLGVTEAALLSLPDEEIPQRIGFVSDRVFEPSPWRRWWAAFWGSGARLGFASAAMLSAAIMVFALTRPAPAPPAQLANRADVAALQAHFDGQLRSAVAQAVAETEARQQENTRKVVAELEQSHYMKLKAIELAVEDNLTRLDKRYGALRLDLASLQTGASR